MSYLVYPPYPGPYPQWHDKIRNVFHIEVDEECDYSHTFTWKNDSTNLPMDLTGYTAELQVRTGSNGNFDAQHDPQIPVITLNTDNGGIVLGGTAGTITINIDSAATKDLIWNRGVYNLILINTFNKRTQYVSGFFSVIAGATKISQTQLTPTP